MSAAIMARMMARGGEGQQDGREGPGRRRVDGLRTAEGRPEAEADGGAGMVGMDVAEPSASGGAVDGAVVLGVVEMEHADREDDGESEDRGLFHISAIIPRPPRRVNTGWRLTKPYGPTASS